jgi:hypothetical protein
MARDGEKMWEIRPCFVKVDIGIFRVFEQKVAKVTERGL